MKTRRRTITLLTAAFLVILALATARPAYAGTPTAQGTGMPSTGARTRGVMSNPAAPQAVHVRPITVGTPLPVLPSGAVAAPGLYPLRATASSVTVSWYDRSNNELGFRVYERNAAGSWRLVHQVASSNVLGSGTGNEPGGTDYSWVDTSTDQSGQCYMVSAYNTSTAGGSSEECTVRPDPSRFPLLVPGWAPAWSGLSDTNDGTGTLVNVDNEQNLEYGDQTDGVNLAWGDNSLWRIEAQGGPHLMKGEAVALKVWGGGWLAYGNQTWGVDLQLSPTPVYEWYVVGLRNDPTDQSWAGADLTDGGTFALWNSSAHDYLVASYQFFGVSLNWSKKITAPPSPNPTPAPARGVRTEQVFNCGADQQPVEVWLEDLTAGDALTDEGALDSQYGQDGCPGFGSEALAFSLQSGHSYQVIAVDTTLAGCDGNDPRQGACQAMITAPFLGDANGYTRTDTVGIGTRISS